MTSIQIGALVYFTVVCIGAWIFFAVIFLQLRHFINMSCYIPVVSRIMTILLIALTVVGYILIFTPGALPASTTNGSTITIPTSGHFDTY